MLSALITSNVDENINVKLSPPQYVPNFYRELSGGDWAQYTLK